MSKLDKMVKYKNINIPKWDYIKHIDNLSTLHFWKEINTWKEKKKERAI